MHSLLKSFLNILSIETHCDEQVVKKDLLDNAVKLGNICRQDKKKDRSISEMMLEFNLT